MMNFFNRNKVDIDSISIPTFGWEQQKNTKDIRQWIDPEKPMALSINYFSSKPDIPTIKEIDKLRAFYRNSTSEVGGGLVEVNLDSLNNHSCVRTIFKIPQEPKGMLYLASFTIPFKTCSYVIKLQAPEYGTTGMRDSFILNKSMSEGKIKFGEDGLEDWFEDPYDKNLKEGMLMNKSELPEYDELFPDHPLSQCRRILNEIASQIVFSDKFGKIKGFPI